MMILGMRNGFILGTVFLFGFAASVGMTEVRADKVFEDQRTQFPGDTFSPTQQVNPSATRQFPGDTFTPPQQANPQP